MNNKIKGSVLSVLFCAATTYANVHVNWTVGYGIYPNGAPDVEAVAPGTGIAAGNAVLWQLIWAPSNLIGIPDPINAAGGFASGDNVVIDTRTIPSGGGLGFDEWLYDLGGATPFFAVVAGSTGSSVFQRVYQFDTAVPNSWYADSDLLTLVATPSDNPPQESIFGSVEFGVALNQQVIPEPSTLALIALGMMSFIARRVRMS
jgi:hypothetical protein